MRCEAHPADEAVGVCFTCGRGVCVACKVRFEGRLQCKPCVESGRASTRPAAVAAATPAPSPVAVGPPAVPPWPPLGDGEKVVSIIVSCVPVIGLFVGALYLGARSPFRRSHGKVCMAIAGLSILAAWLMTRPFWYVLAE